MAEDLGDEGMAEGVDIIARHAFTKERQPQAMSEILYHQPNQSFQQDHTPSYTQPTQNQDRGTVGRKSSRF